MKKQVSIKWKIFGYFAGFSALLLVLLWLFQVVFLDDFYRWIKIEQAVAAQRQVGAALVGNNVQGVVDQVADSEDACIVVLDTSGGTLYSSVHKGDCLIHRMAADGALDIVEKTKNAGGTFSQIYDKEWKKNEGEYNGDVHVPPRAKGGTTLLYSAQGQAGGSAVYVVVNSGIMPVSSTVDTIRVQLYFVSGIMIFCSAILAFLMSKKIARPIELVNQGAKEMAQGRYDVGFFGTGYREIVELADTLSHTAKELEKTELLRRELVANVSHDLRTPLTLIGGYAEAMRDLPQENSPENAQIIIDEVARLTALVNHMLDISQTQAGIRTTKKEEFCFEDMVGENVSRMQELLRHKGYKLQFNLLGSARVLGNRQSLSQAVYNLLINGVNYTGENKTVVLRQTARGNIVRLEVEDSGKGISEESLLSIWDRYFREDTCYVRGVVGSGLGLSIVKSVLEEHNGNYGAYNTGNGSVFWVEMNIF